MAQKKAKKKKRQRIGGGIAIQAGNVLSILDHKREILRVECFRKLTDEGWNDLRKLLIPFLYEH